MEEKSFKEKIKSKTIDAITSPLGVISTLYVAGTIAVNMVAMPLFTAYNGVERMVGGEVKTENVELINKEFIQGYNSGFYFGDFVTADNDTLRLSDESDILSGKFWPNTQLRRAEVGENYEMTFLEGPLSNKLIRLKEPKNESLDDSINSFYNK